MLRFLLPAVALALLVPSIVSTVVFAQEPQRLGEQITDEAGVLSEGDLQQLLDAFERSTNSQLHVLFVETTGDLALPDYVEETVILNNFGAGESLFVVAVEDRTYQLWIGDRLADAVTVDEQDDILIDEVEPFLASGDYDGSVRALAAGLALAATGEQLPVTPVATPSNGGGESNGGGGGPNIFVVLAVLAAIGAAIWGFFKLLGRLRPRGGGKAAAPQANLAERANEVLLEADEAVRDANQEVSFAEAEFGPTAVGEARKALAEAEARLNEAFRLRQQLDDEVKESASERDAMLQGLIAAAEAAIEIAEQQGERADSLRELERRADELIAALPGKIRDAETRVEKAQGDFAYLQANARGVADEVDGNVVEAGKCVEYADEQLAAAREALPQEQGEPSAPAIRAAQAALAEADRLASAVTELRSRVDEARAALPGEIRAAELAISTAQRAANRPSEASSGLIEAERLLGEARKLSTGPAADPLTARSRAVEARSVAEKVASAVRSEQERQQQLAATAGAAVASARSTVDRAEDYIQSRRLGVGGTARTRLAEAKRSLIEAQGLERSDPERSASLANRAGQLAEEALRLASRDFSDYDQPAARRSSSVPGNRRGRSGGDIAAAGAVLADILGAGVDGGRWGSPRRQSPSPTRGRSSGGGFNIPGLSGPKRSGGSSRSSGGRSRGGRW